MFLVGAWEPAAVRHTKTRQGMVDWIPNVRQSHWREFKHRCDKIQFELSTNQESIQSIFFSVTMPDDGEKENSYTDLYSIVML